MHGLLAFLAFGLCASAVYVLNDLLDLESDRVHVRKRRRPFASGAIPVWQGTVLIPVLLLASAALAAQLPWAFGAVLTGYFAMTLAYSVRLKRQVIVDVLLLAALYTTRVVAGGGHERVAVVLAAAMSMFLFLSLAMVKRYSGIDVDTRSEQDSRTPDAATPCEIFRS